MISALASGRRRNETACAPMEDPRSAWKTNLANFCSRRDLLKAAETLAFGSLNVGGMLVGGVHLKDCPGSPVLPWWLLIHGIFCTLYYVACFAALLAIPLEANRRIRQVSTLERIIGRVLDSLGMPAGRHFVRDDCPVSSFQEVVCNNKDRYRHKLHYHELAFAVFGVVFLLSAFLGLFASVLILPGRKCNPSLHIYTICLLTVCFLQFAVKGYRILQEGTE